MEIKFKRVEAGKYDVLVDGSRVGEVRKGEQRSPVMSGRIAVGYKVRTRWFAQIGSGYDSLGWGTLREAKEGAIKMWADNVR